MGKRKKNESITGSVPVFSISVRALVEFILREGDLDARGSSFDAEAMQKGSRLHRRLQRQMGPEYQAEVPFKEITEFEDLTLQVEGRADGVFREQEKTWIDEIKGTYADLASMAEPVGVHLAQARCYAAFCCSQRGLEEIGVQLTYARLDPEQEEKDREYTEKLTASGLNTADPKKDRKIRRFRQTYTAEELDVWYRDLVSRYHLWISTQLAWRRERDSSMQDMDFPFIYREGQRRLTAAVYHTVTNGHQLFVQAPTGIGKTMSVIFPAVRAVGQGAAQMIFYLTAKTITRTVAWEAFEILRKKGLAYKTIILTAKEKMCLNPEMVCDPEHCPYAKGHYDRVNDAVFSLWTQENGYSREILLEHAEKYRVCPFEMSLDLALWVDAVICDYNYVFDPDVCLKRFFGEGAPKEDFLFLVDEAHNLVDRAREMYSAAVIREEVMQARRQVKEYSPDLYAVLGRLSKMLLGMRRECEDEKEGVRVGRAVYRLSSLPALLPGLFLQTQAELEKFLEEFPDAAGEELLDFYFSVRTFNNTLELVDENYAIYSETGEDGRFYLHLYCVNPAKNLSDRLSRGKSTIFFSATLHPLSYYKKLLSTREDDYWLYLESPFAPENRLILSGIDVSSLYSRRGYDQYRKIASYISTVVRKKQGNYFVFFPSYQLMNDVYEVYEQEFSCSQVQCIRQEPFMKEQEREEFLERFEEGGKTLAAFAILGGIFSEGIDLAGERLIGALIVGTGLPQICCEREVLRRCYDGQGLDGYAYAYRNPGMNKVLQAAGRVIRSREDRGVILLLDHRFQGAEYSELFPKEWADRKICRLPGLEQQLEEFWNEEELF